MYNQQLMLTILPSGEKMSSSYVRSFESTGMADSSISSLHVWLRVYTYVQLSRYIIVFILNMATDLTQAWRNFL